MPSSRTPVLAPRGVRTPADLDVPTSRRVAHGIAGEIGKRAVQLLATAEQGSATLGRESNLVPAGGQELRFTAHLTHELERIHRHIVLCRSTRFERRQGEQLFDQALHARGLLAREGEEVNDVRVRKVFQPVDQGLEKTADHGQRRAQLMRDVGHEVAPHGFEPFDLRDIARQHHAPPGRERNHDDLQAALAPPRRMHHERLGMMGARSE